jgi:hypothetical protein
MTVIGEAVVTPEVYRLAVRRLSRSRLLRVRIAGSVLVVMGALLFFPELDAMPAGGALIAVGLMFLFYVPFMALRRSSEVVAPALREPWKYQLDEERLTVATPLATSEYRWDRFTSAQEFPEFWLLRTALVRQAVILVKHAFTPEDQLSVALIIQRYKLSEPVAPTVAAPR